MPIDDDLRTFVTAGNFAVLTTLFEDGSPQTNVMWVDADDDHVMINTERHRQKYVNVQRDPRVTVTVWDADNPYRYVEFRGEVVGEVGGDDARAHIDALSNRYVGKDYANEVVSERVILRIAPHRVNRHF